MVGAFGKASQRQRGASVCRDGDAVHQVVGGGGEAAQIRHCHAVADQVYRAGLGALHGDRLAAVLHTIHVAGERDGRRRGVDDVVGDGMRGLVASGVGGGDGELRASGLSRAGEQRHDAGTGVNMEVPGVAQAVSDAVRISGGSGVDSIADGSAIGNIGGGGSAGEDRYGVVHQHTAAGNNRKIACRIDGISMVGAFCKICGRDSCTGIGRDSRAGPLVAGGARNVAKLTDHDIVVDEIDGAAFGTLHGGMAIVVEHDEVFMDAAVGVKFLHKEVIA